MRNVRSLLVKAQFGTIGRSESLFDGRIQFKCDGTRWCTWGEVKGELANGVGNPYPSHYLGTWCIQHHYRWCAQLGCQQSTELRPPPIEMDSCFAERRNLVSARVPSHFKRRLHLLLHADTLLTFWRSIGGESKHDGSTECATNSTASFLSQYIIFSLGVQL
jgi:hypothetical protein